MLILKHNATNPDYQCLILFDETQEEHISLNADKDSEIVNLYSNAEELKYLRNEDNKFNFVLTVCVSKNWTFLGSL